MSLNLFDSMFSGSVFAAIFLGFEIGRAKCSNTAKIASAVLLIFLTCSTGILGFGASVDSTTFYSNLPMMIPALTVLLSMLVILSCIVGWIIGTDEKVR